MADVILDTPAAPAPVKPNAVLRGLLHNPAVLFGGTVIAIVLLRALLAPWLGTIDPTGIDPIARHKGRRSSASGRLKSTVTSSRRTNAWSMRWAALVVIRMMPS